MSDQPDDVGVSDAVDEHGHRVGSLLWSRLGRVVSFVLVPGDRS